MCFDIFGSCVRLNIDRWVRLVELGVGGEVGGGAVGGGGVVFRGGAVGTSCSSSKLDWCSTAWAEIFCFLFRHAMLQQKHLSITENNIEKHSGLQTCKIMQGSKHNTIKATIPSEPNTEALTRLTSVKKLFIF